MQAGSKYVLGVMKTRSCSRRETTAMKLGGYDPSVGYACEFFTIFVKESSGSNSRGLMSNSDVAIGAILSRKMRLRFMQERRSWSNANAVVANRLVVNDGYGERGLYEESSGCAGSSSSTAGALNHGCGSRVLVGRQTRPFAEL